MAQIRVVECTCRNLVQDNMYGKGKRLANENSTGTEARCSVCGAVHRGGQK